MSKFYKALEVAKKGENNQKPSGKPLLVPTAAVLRKGFVVLDDRDSEITEYFRFFRSKIVRPAQGNPPRTIMITSALKGEGKTFVASNLAVSISQAIEEYVLLMDTDLRKPNIYETFGLSQTEKGLSSYLEKQTPLSDLLIKSAIDKLTILPAGNSTKIPAELLSSDKMKNLIQETGNRYPDRFVILDSAPLELTPESSVLVNYVDAVILVVRYGKTPRHSVKSALEKIPKEKLIGIVFNGNERPLGRYGRYSYYGYGERK